LQYTTILNKFMKNIKVKSHPNIALVKYWGKRNEEKNLPSVGSISITLDELSTITEVYINKISNDEFIINNKKAGNYILSNLNFESFFTECFSEINDYDFKDLFNKKQQEEISQQVNENISQYEREILLNEVSYEGEIKRMKELSGLKRKFLS